MGEREDGGGCVLGGERDGQERKGAGGGRNREGEDYVTDNSRRSVCGACACARVFCMQGFTSVHARTDASVVPSSLSLFLLHSLRRIEEEEEAKRDG